MNLYNTLSKKVEPFIPYNPEKVTMYTCGPTVYHYAHIGNLRCYIMEDVLEKALNYLDFPVLRCMNITDVGHLSSDADSGEDKMVKGAKREHKTVLEIAEMYTNAFFRDCEKLNIKKPEIVSPATNNIEEYITIIKKLLEKEYAYISNGNVYFDVSKLKNYYTLTNHKEEELVVGARSGVEEDLGKRNQSDFVLWFTKSKFEDQELKWDSPWGVGYPGWHIECSGISIKNLGEYLDIHCGGVDNIFPHHTNEIAQSEGYLGHDWCKYWFHVEHLNDATGKMSKSKGEFLTVSLLEEKGYNPLAYRLFCLQSHYRNPLVFSYENLDGAVNAYQKLQNKVIQLKQDNTGEFDQNLYEKYNQAFKNTLSDDLNTAATLTVVYDVLKADMSNKTKLKLIEQFDTVLSLDLGKQEKEEISDELLEMIHTKIQERNTAKQEKDFARADSIRNELLEQGIVLKDTREGTLFEIGKA